MDVLKKVVYGEYYIDLLKGGDVYSANDDFLHISGYSRQDVEEGRLNMFGFVPDEYRKKYEEIINSSLDGKSPVYIQHPFKRKNGSVIHVLCMGRPVADDPTKCVVIITDYTEHIQLLSKYNSSQIELDSLTSTVPGGVVIFSVGNELTIFKTNEEFSRMFGLTGEVSGKTFEKLITKEDYELLYKRICISISDNKPLNFEFRYKFNESTYKWFRIVGNIYKYSYGEPLFYSIIMDITEDKRLNNELIMQTEKFRIIADNTEELYFEYDAVSDKMKLTTALCRYYLDYDNTIYNYWQAECPKEFVHPDDYQAYKQLWDKMLQSPGRGSFEFRTKAYDDDYTWYNMNYVSLANEHNNVVEVFGKIISIQHLKTLKSKIDTDTAYIKQLLETDNLTGLLNRKTFKKKAGAEIMSMDKSCVYGVVYSDINDFSYVNENFGYEAGNKMLRDFAKVLLSTSTNLLGCRIYSDYFIGLYRAPTREQLIKSIEMRNVSFTQLQKEKYPASDIHVSCGICILTDANEDITIAIDNANLARRSVKSNSSILCGIYSQRMRTQRAYEQSVCSELHSAIENRQVEMFLQPKFHLETRDIVGAEALARWRNLDGSYKMPFEFIPILERVGYIDELDFFIYEEALRTISEWQRQGKTPVPISVNFSQHHIQHPQFVKMLIDAADKYGIEKSLIEIEITESSFSGDMQKLFDDLQSLRSCGFKISIDDFGIGYSTLSVLMKAPVDIVKVDKSFIDNIGGNKHDRDFVKNMCKLIDVTDKDIIFEGVETETQAEILSEIGYTTAQGWLFDKAIPLKKFNEKYMS